MNRILPCLQTNRTQNNSLLSGNCLFESPTACLTRSKINIPDDPMNIDTFYHVGQCQQAKCVNISCDIPKLERKAEDVLLADTLKLQATRLTVTSTPIGGTTCTVYFPGVPTEWT